MLCISRMSMAEVKREFYDVIMEICNRSTTVIFIIVALTVFCF